MTNEQKTADIGELVKRLLAKADTIEVGERIAWGSDSAIMREAAQTLADQEKEIVGIDEERIGNRDGCIERNKIVHSLEAQLAEAKAEIERMTPRFVAYEYLESPAGREMIQDFAKWAIREGAFQAADLDGLSIQEKAHELGLIEPTTYDPEKHGPSDCAEPGDEWFVFTRILTEPTATEEDENELLTIAYLQGAHSTRHIRGVTDSMVDVAARAYMNRKGGHGAAIWEEELPAMRDALKAAFLLGGNHG